MERTDVYSQIEKHYRANFPILVKKVINSSGGYHNAEDAVQEAYTRALKYWRTFDGKQAFDKWFGTILFNCVKDQQRDTILKGMVMEDMMLLPEPPRDDIFANVLEGELKKAILKEPLHHQPLLNMFLFDGFTSGEIAEGTGFKANAIRKVVSRFRDKYTT